MLELAQRVQETELRAWTLRTPERLNETAVPQNKGGQLPAGSSPRNVSH